MACIKDAVILSSSLKLEGLLHMRSAIFDAGVVQKPSERRPEVARPATSTEKNKTVSHPSLPSLQR